MADRHGKGYKAYRRARERLKRKRLPCAWCGEAIDYDAAPFTPMSFEADHAMPLSKGGEVIPRTADGLQPMHMKCNREKSDRYDSMPGGVNLRAAT